MAADMRVRRGGNGEPLLLLLHGMGATGDVWDPLIRHWPGRWIAPDLPGHGGSAHRSGYSFESLAAGVASVIDPDEPLMVLGHSLGGVVGLTLAGSRFGVRIEAVVGVGIKVAWTAEELEKARLLARRPPARYATRDEAVARYLRVSGLTGLLDDDDPTIEPGLAHEDGQWRLAMDPEVFAVGAPDMGNLLGDVSVPVVLARGERDPMVTDEQLAQLTAHSPASTSQRTASLVTLPGLGHNAHIEHPKTILPLLPHPH